MPILRVKDADGNIIAIPAIQGEPGYTPVKGEDYYTEEELAALGAEVLAALPSTEMVVTLDDGSTATYQIYGQVVTE